MIENRAVKGAPGTIRDPTSPSYDICNVIADTESGIDEVLRAVYYDLDPVMMYDVRHLYSTGILIEVPISHNSPINEETEKQIKECKQGEKCLKPMQKLRELLLEDCKKI